MINKIVGFKDQYDFLALDYPCKFKFEGIEFNSCTSAFYAQKSPDVNARKKFARLNPLNARRKAKNIPEEDDYKENREEHLYLANKAKFDANPDLKKKLLDTGDAKLINDVPYKAEWIGVYMQKGYNALGKVLMRLRSEYKKENK